MNKNDFRLAFAVENYKTNKLKDDPDGDFLKWIFQIHGRKDGEYFQKPLNYHKCTDEDFDQFYPIMKTAEKQFQKMREDPIRGFLCLDWGREHDDYEIFGNEVHDEEYSRLEVILTSCNYNEDKT